MKNIYISAQTPYLANSSCQVMGQKTLRLQDDLNCNISKKK